MLRETGGLLSPTILAQIYYISNDVCSPVLSDYPEEVGGYSQALSHDLKLGFMSGCGGGDDESF